MTRGHAWSHAGVLTLQRALDPQGDKPEIAGVYLERGDQAYASYGSIEGCTLLEEELTLTLDEYGAEALGGGDKALAI